MTAVHGRADSSHQPHQRVRSLINVGTAYDARTTQIPGLTPLRPSLRLAAGLIVLAVPLSGCGTGALWDKFTAKDDTFDEEPADKLYNEGLYLMNQQQG